MARRELFSCPHCSNLQHAPRGMTGPAVVACSAHCGIPLLERNVHICPYCSKHLHWRVVTRAKRSRS